MFRCLSFVMYCLFVSLLLLPLLPPPISITTMIRHVRTMPTNILLPVSVKKALLWEKKHWNLRFQSTKSGGR